MRSHFEGFLPIFRSYVSFKEGNCCNILLPPGWFVGLTAVKASYLLEVRPFMPFLFQGYKATIQGMDTDIAKQPVFFVAPTKSEKKWSFSAGHSQILREPFSETCSGHCLLLLHLLVVVVVAAAAPAAGVVVVVVAVVWNIHFSPTHIVSYFVLYMSYCQVLWCTLAQGSSHGSLWWCLEEKENFAESETLGSTLVV